MGWWRRGEPADRETLPEWSTPPSDVDDFRLRVQAVGLSEHAEALVSLVRPSAHLISDGSVEVGGVGRSRLGGLPDLPSETAWPVGPTGPLSFVLQVDLAEVEAQVPGSGLPATGLLSFFYDAVTQSAWGFDPGDRASWAVIHTAPGAGLEQQAFPDGLPDEGRFVAAGLRAVSAPSYPDGESPEVEGLGIDQPQLTYGRVLGDVDEALTKVLGHPDAIQGPMQVECQLASRGIYCGDGNYLQRPEAQLLVTGATDWRLIAQVDSSEATTGMGWGDGGRLYFWMTEDDLRAHRWDQVWMILQCY